MDELTFLNHWFGHSPLEKVEEGVYQIINQRMTKFVRHPQLEKQLNEPSLIFFHQDVNTIFLDGWISTSFGDYFIVAMFSIHEQGRLTFDPHRLNEKGELERLPRAILPKLKPYEDIIEEYFQSLLQHLPQTRLHIVTGNYTISETMCLEDEKR